MPRATSFNHITCVVGARGVPLDRTADALRRILTAIGPAPSDKKVNDLMSRACRIALEASFVLFCRSHGHEPQTTAEGFPSPKEFSEQY